MPCNKCWSVWMFLSHGLLPAMGQTPCPTRCESTTDRLTSLNADVLLPCVFKASQGVEQAVVWSRGPTTNLVELKPLGEFFFWDPWPDKIEVFKDLLREGNFSIVFRQVQESDLGLYRCELFEDEGCRVGCQEVQLSLQKAFSGGASDVVSYASIGAGGARPGFVVEYWYYIAAGGAVFISLLLGCACFVRNRRVQMKRPSSGKSTIEWTDNDFYESVSYNQVQLSQEAECSQSSDQQKQDIGNRREMSCAIYASIAEFHF